MKQNVEAAISTLKRELGIVPNGVRHLVVLDRGWIFAGDLSRDAKGINLLTNAVNVRKWNKGGFGALSQGAKGAEARLDECAPLRFRDDAMIFSVPIGEDWENE